MYHHMGQLRLATNSNDTMLILVEIIEDGIPESREDFPQALREFYQFRDYLYTVDGVVVYCGSVVIPPSLREECLDALRYMLRMVDVYPCCHEQNAQSSGLGSHKERGNDVPRATIPDLSDDVAAAQQTTICPPNKILAALRSRDDPIPRRTQICASAATTLIKSITWNDVRIATASDSDMSALVDAIHNGFPDMPSAMFSAVRM